jgi:para-nitrobenzyl esterase
VTVRDAYAEVDTHSGRLRGNAHGGVYAFKGVPYGAATGPERRFLPPEPAEPWTGVRDATAYGSSCPQIGMRGGPRDPLREEFPGFFDPAPAGEDCLVLNVWTPGLEDGADRPVMVWLHGGGLHAGTGSSPLYEGTALARRGNTVIVTLNHRLGVLGYLHLGPHMGEQYRSSGMVGMLDVVAALEWVRDNIASFGGDPKNVTIFGQSGGGQKVVTLLAMPAAEGLFHRAVAQSGAILRVGRRMDPGELSAFVLDRLGVRSGDAERLHQLEVDDIVDVGIEIYSRFGSMVFSSVVDGFALPQDPVDQFSAGVASNVPLMIGATTNEFRGIFAPGAPLDDATLLSRLASVLGRRDTGAGALEPLAVYRQLEPSATNVALFGDILTHHKQVQTMQTAEAKVTGGTAPVYSYLFAAPPAYHCGELAYLFRWGVDDALADQLGDAWLAFARGGDPNHERLPKWPTYSLNERATMVFDYGSRVTNDPLGEVRRRWETIPAYL